jgi:hypothetical protein
LLEVEEIMRHAGMITDFMPESYRDPALWFDGREEPDPHSLSGKTAHSAVLEANEHYGGSACVFLRPDHKCALQVASEAAGYHPWRLKPFYCILHPLDFDEAGRITLDETSHMKDEPASCLVFCMELVPLYMTFEPELRYLLGDKGYERIVAQGKKDDLFS